MRLQDVIEIGEAGPLPFVGLGILSVAVPYLLPSLRPQIGVLLKGSAKLFLEAEFGADNALTDRLVDASVDTLMQIAPGGTKEERQRRTDREVDRFFSKARAAARRRSFNRDDERRRYRNHLTRMEHALKSRRHRAGTQHKHAVDHALSRINDERHLSESRRGRHA